MATQQKESSVKVRWTPALAKAFTPIVNSFIELCGRPSSQGGLGLNPTQAMIVIQLMSFKWDRRMPRPAIKTLATRLGVSDTTVRNNIDDMEKKRLIVKHLTHGAPTSYDLTPLFNRLEVIQAEAEVRKSKAKEEAEAKQYPEYYASREEEASPDAT